MVQRSVIEINSSDGQPGGGNQTSQDSEMENIIVPSAIINNQATGTAKGYKTQAKVDGIPSRYEFMNKT